MKRRLALTIIGFTAAFGLAACAYNAKLGRNQFLLVDNEALSGAGEQAWAAALKEGKVSRDAAANSRLRTVATRLIEAAGLSDRPWVYVVFEDDTANAFVVPGGKVGVNTGLLIVAKTDGQLAAVLGHEIAHAIYNHAAERYSQAVGAQLLIGGAQVAVGGSNPDAARLIGSLGGAGAQLGLLLPFSRKRELEADRMGVEIMARAGYRPVEALDLWRNMAASRTSGGPPQFLSTHPSDVRRLKALEDHLRAGGWR